MTKVKLIDFWKPKDFQIKCLEHIIQDTSGLKIIQTDIPEIIIYSCFGENHKKPKFNKSKKVFYTGENKRPQAQADLNLTFDYTEHNHNIRFPLWYLYINWWSSLPLSFNHIDSLFQKNNDILKNKTKFCAFIARHSRQCPRGRFVQMLSQQYKTVECAGYCLNNTGRILGGTEETKIKYLSNFKFCIAFENSEHPGYCTEKILHSFMAGCIPIYWGDPEVSQDYNEKSFLCLKETDVASMEKLIEKIKELDQDDDLWLAMYQEICFAKTKEQMINKIKEIEQKIKELIH